MDALLAFLEMALSKATTSRGVVPRDSSRPHPEVPISTNKKANTATRTLLFTQIAAAIVQYVTAAVVLGGKSLTPQALAAVFQAYLQAEKDLLDARTTVTARQQARDAALGAALALMPDLRKYLSATYGEQSTTYAAFGLPVTQKPVKSAQTKAESAAKATATRKSHKAALTAPAAPPAPPPAPATPPAKS
ncbi:MAG TPA: hypothetical protein VIF09_09895 [Polyangiaceae bacterium]|jgi:hypothetical protein